jgi:hypothetical protein
MNRKRKSTIEGYGCPDIASVRSLRADGLIIVDHAFMGKAVYSCMGHFD